MHSFHSSCLTTGSAQSPVLYSKNTNVTILLHLIRQARQGMQKTTFFLNDVIQIQALDAFPQTLAFKILGRPIALSTLTVSFQCKTLSDSGLGVSFSLPCSQNCFGLETGRGNLNVCLSFLTTSPSRLPF